MTAKHILAVVGITTALKVLLLPSYRSTDFEVHRNWLAITHSLPLKDWYYESTSIWTLDYPPFFAWFEWLLSLPASLVDPEMLVVANLNYASMQTLYYQRFTVIIMDLLLYLSVWRFCRDLSPLRRIGAFALALFHPGLIMVDHIHFQYNGFLFGILILSLWALETQQYLLGATAFAVLLNFKHLFLYMAPAFFIFILRSGCTRANAGLPFPLNLNITALLSIALAVGSVFVVSFGPFVLLGQLQQVLSRMFPFQRGLVHAYWAPNAWSLYLSTDRLLSIGSRLRSSGGTSGIVGDVTPNILPLVSPRTSIVCTLIALGPLCWSLWKRPLPSRFTVAACLSAMCFFMFGYHVHEKAIITATLPLGLIAVRDPFLARSSLLLSTIGHFALFPLLFGAQELIPKIALLFLHCAVCITLYRAIHSRMTLARHEIAFLFGLVPLCIVTELLLPIYLPQLPFLPLMLTSTYCAVGVMYAFLQLYISFLLH